MNDYKGHVFHRVNAFLYNIQLPCQRYRLLQDSRSIIKQAESLLTDMEYLKRSSEFCAAEAETNIGYLKTVIEECKNNLDVLCENIIKKIGYEVQNN